MTDRPTSILCLACDRPLAFDLACLPGVEVPRDDSVSVVFGGLFFRATGNYGSAIFDPVADEFLEVVICDACIMAKSETHGIRHARRRDRRITGEEVYRDWRETGGGVEWLRGAGGEVAG